MRWFATGQFTANYLDEAGFKVLEVCNAEEAMLLLTARPDAQVLMIDVHTRGQNGFELAREAHEHSPGVVILIVSVQQDPDGRDLPEGAVLLRRPYEPAAVVRSIREMIAKRAET